LAYLVSARDQALPLADELSRLTGHLKTVNERLWQVEDELRLCEKAADFGPRFVQLARSVYQWNDQRAALKRQINELLGAAFLEEKSYEGPGATPNAGDLSE
jgi:predicted  nucleic acid-binding Zn-ribbon protein